MGIYASKYGDLIMTEKTLNISTYEMVLGLATMIYFLGLKIICSISYKQNQNGVGIIEVI